MKEKLIYLLEDLKDNYTPKKSTEIITMICEDMSFNELEDFLQESTKMGLFDNHNPLFYDELAIMFAEDLAHNSLMYFSFWEPLLYHFNSKTKKQLFESALDSPIENDANYYLKGFQALENDEFELALRNFDSVDHFVASYFVGFCYLDLDNFENSIKQNEMFLKDLSDFLNTDAPKKLNLLESPEFVVLKWNVYNDLGFAYNRTEDFYKAKTYYEKSLSIFNLDDAFTIFNIGSENLEVTDFEVFINNYIHCLTKTNDFKKAIEVLKFVISKNPSDLYFYQSRLSKLEEKTKNNNYEIIAERILRIRKPFGITNFTETRLVSRERLLEDLIIEQIKRGFKVFNKKLEVYQDHLMYGQQYPVKNCNGRLDLLLIEKEDDILYVVELKRDGAGIEVVQQVEKYMQGLTIEFGREVKGIICLHQPDAALKELVKTKENIELFVYEFAFRKV